MESSNEPDFEADVAIGKGLRFIDRNGVATIDGGRLTLRKSNGDVVVEAQMSEISADKAKMSGGGAARVWIDGDRYTIEPQKVRRANPATLRGDAANLGGDITRLKKGR